MNEREIRLRLLEDELGALHNGIAAFDARASQIKGWCITLVSGLLALAFTQDQPLLMSASAILVFAFWVVESHTASLQRVMIRRLQHIEVHFEGRGAVASVDDTALSIPGMSAGFRDPPEVTGWTSQVRFELSVTWIEAISPYRALFYVVILLGSTALGVSLYLA